MNFCVTFLQNSHFTYIGFLVSLDALVLYWEQSLPFSPLLFLQLLNRISMLKFLRKIVHTIILQSVTLFSDKFLEIRKKTFPHFLSFLIKIHMFCSKATCNRTTCFIVLVKICTQLAKICKTLHHSSSYSISLNCIE